jgi:helix-turn-helix, Psq domain
MSNSESEASVEELEGSGYDMESYSYLFSFKFILKNCNFFNIFRLSPAVEECRAGKLSQRAAAEKYGIKKSTVAYHVKNPEAKTGKGLAPLLTENQRKRNRQLGSRFTSARSSTVFSRPY